MTRILLLLAMMMAASTASAQSVRMAPLSPASAKMIEDVVDAAHRLYPRMPSVRLTSTMGQICGGETTANGLMRYCTSDNAIFVNRDLADVLPDDGRAAYMVAHLMGHAAQVRHGVATDALNAIRAEPAREAELRGMVTRQVECLAGMFYAAATGSTRASLNRWFTDEPFTDAHWGRNPMTAGPRVSVGLAARDEWFRTGLRADGPAACVVGEMSADKLVRALRP